MDKGFFITGTDTWVGKTMIAGAMIKALCFLGFKTSGMKPVESGCVREDGVLIPSDGMFLRQIAQMQEPIEEVTPCCFESPLAPLPASELENTYVSSQRSGRPITACMQITTQLLWKGSAGLWSRSRKDYFVVDLAKEIGLPLDCCCKAGAGIDKPYHADRELCIERGA